MTTNEYEAILEGMTPDEFQKFKKDFGGDGQTPAYYVDAFARNPGQERLLCRILKRPTEDEKRMKLQTGTTIHQNVGNAVNVAGHTVNSTVNVTITVTDLLTVIQQQIERSEDIPPEEKRGVLEKVKGLLANPYVQAAGTTVIGEYLKGLIFGSSR